MSMLALLIVGTVANTQAKGHILECAWMVHL